MLATLAEISKKNNIIGFFIRIICKTGFTVLTFIKRISSFLRMHSIGGKKYRPLKNYFNLHLGERCFIIATGPSLTVDDLEKLKNEYTFGMNSIIKVYEKTEFRPTYYGIQDHIVYKEFQKEINRYYGGENNIFISDRIASHYHIDKKWNIFPLDMVYHAYDRWFNDKYFVKFSDDSFKQVYSGFSITYSLIEIAVYMGFSEIYLLGADCSFLNKEKLHFIDYKTVDKALDTAQERNIAGYIKAKEYADRHNVKIYNATRGGALEVFERRSLEEIIGD